MANACMPVSMAAGAEGEEQRDFDFLSSVELTIVDQTESLMMQNWAHLEQLMG